jgi:diaminopimelate decarboxylase
MNLARPHLKLHGGSLSIGGISAADLVRAYGTPLYVTDLDRVVERYDTAFRSVSSRHGNSLIAYAYKANSCKEVARVLSRRGAGATIVSLAGLALTKECGVDRRKVVFDGPSKSRAELVGAVTDPVGMINVESFQELADIESVCDEEGVDEVRVGIRVNFGIRADTHSGLATGVREGKFGIAEDEVLRFFSKGSRRLKHVRVRGLHSHVGSQIMDMKLFRTVTEKMVRLAEALDRTGATQIDEFNFGGGLGVDYDGTRADGFAGYADATAGTFGGLRGRSGGTEARLVFELGRSLVADSTVLLSKVNYLKKAGNTDWALLDAGMNDFIRPALYGAFHRIVPAQTKRVVGSRASYSFGGPVCESTDTFGSGRRLGVRLSQGDVVAILDTGAYGISMASHYNMRPLPAVVAVSEGRHWLAQPAD